MADIKNKLILYRERQCKIANKNIEIEILKLSGAKDNDPRIVLLEKEINELENENKRRNTKGTFIVPFKRILHEHYYIL